MTKGTLIAWLLATVVFADEGRVYHPITIAEFPKKVHTHVCTTGTIALVKGEADGDLHIRVEDGKAFIVAEAIPKLQPEWERPPHKGEVWTLCGITRFDKRHGWWEIHPIEHGHRRLK